MASLRNSRMRKPVRRDSHCTDNRSLYHCIYPGHGSDIFHGKGDHASGRNQRHAGYKDLTRAEYDKIRTNSRIKEISYNILVGMASNETLAKRQTEIRYGEPEDLEWGFRKPEKGTYPRNKKEILADTIVLDLMGVPRELGKRLPWNLIIWGISTETLLRCRESTREIPCWEQVSCICQRNMWRK